MDINGVWASVNFPSMITGFCGRVFFDARDRDLGLACVRAWNDWLFEECTHHTPNGSCRSGSPIWPTPRCRGRDPPQRRPRLHVGDLPGAPHEIGLPSLWDRAHWDPIMEAVVETDTVVSLHVGSSGLTPPPPGAGMDSLQLGATLFGQLSSSPAPNGCGRVRGAAPSLKIAMSEGGIGWVAMLRDRLDNIVDRSGYGVGWEVRPSEVLRRNFWFCTIDDPSTIDTRHAIGRPHHGRGRLPARDSTWPDTQAVIERCWGHIPPTSSAPCAARTRPRSTDTRSPTSCCHAERTPHVHAHGREADARLTRARSSSCSPARCGARLQRPLAGHITVNLGDGTLLCNPWLLTWAELRPAQVLPSTWRAASSRGLARPARHPAPPGAAQAEARYRLAAHNTPLRHRVGRPAEVPPILDQSSALAAARSRWSTSTRAR